MDMSNATQRLSSPTIAHIQRTEFFLSLDAREFFVSFEDCPDFNNAAISQIFDFRFSHDGLHWDSLDVDIELDALKNPEKFTLKFRP
jgi:hypothetical protein